MKKKILLISDEETGNYINSAPSFLNGYFQDNLHINFEHKYINWSNPGFEKDFSKYDLIGYSCVNIKKLEENFQHLSKHKKRLVIGGPIINLIESILIEQSFLICQIMGEWWFEDYLNIPRNKNLLSDQKIKLTETTGNKINNIINKHNTSVVIPIHSGFGCSWNKCKFCNYSQVANMARIDMKQNYISKSIKNIQLLIESLKEQLGHSDNIEILLTSDSISPRELLDLAVIFKDQFIWNCYLRVNCTFSNLNLRELKQSGLNFVYIGIEIPHNDGLSLLNKGITLDVIRSTLAALKANDIHISASFMYNVPGFYQFDDAIENFKKYILPYVYEISLFPLTIYEHSLLYDEFLSKGFEPVVIGLQKQIIQNLDEEILLKNKKYIKQLYKLSCRNNIKVSMSN